MHALLGCYFRQFLLRVSVLYYIGIYGVHYTTCGMCGRWVQHSHQILYHTWSLASESPLCSDQRYCCDICQDFFTTQIPTSVSSIQIQMLRVTSKRRCWILYLTYYYEEGEESFLGLCISFLAEPHSMYSIGCTLTSKEVSLISTTSRVDLDRWTEKVWSAVNVLMALHQLLLHLVISVPTVQS